MSATIVKTEKLENADIKKLQVKEGGAKVAGNGPGGSGKSSVSVFANVGSKPTLEGQAYFKVTNEAKHLKLRLKQQNALQTHSKTPQTLKNSTYKQNSIKRIINDSDSRELQVDNDKTKSHPIVKRSKLQTTVGYENRPSSPLGFVEPQYSLLKCGEIFVTNNAKKWTFVCTYCQKSTRDIGEFVCHIQLKHLDGHYNDDEEDEICGHAINRKEAFNEREDSFNNHDQDYFDCGNFLDVNVHTDADDTTPNNNKIENKTVVPMANNSNTKDNINNHQLNKNNSKFVVDLVEEDYDDNDNYDKKPTYRTDYEDAEQFGYDMEEEDGVEIVDDENDEHIENDHLAFLKTDSIEETTRDAEDVGGGGDDGGKLGIRKYRSHVRGKAYCNLCDKTFQYYSLYRNHMIKHSNLTPYKCQFCSKAFKSKQAIRYHMNTHTKEVQYTCPLCPTTYGTENQFITHVLNHESDTCFPCMVCAKILKSDQDRDKHLETHTEERPFGCEYCNKRFRQKHHLSNHLKLHCQYRCDFCKEEFSSTQTQRRPYACPRCEDYPHIRIQVEKQRSKSLNNQDVNPLELPYENMPQDGDTKCVDLADLSDDEESETSTSQNGQTRIACKYCRRSYKKSSALNYHVRQKHPHLWNKM